MKFQVQLQKRTIKYDLPMQIGFFVYGYAKLHMLRFYYDVIDRYIARGDYDLMQMDTGGLFYNVKKNVRKLTAVIIQNKTFQILCIWRSQLII